MKSLSTKRHKTGLNHVSFLRVSSFIFVGLSCPISQSLLF